MQDACRRTFTEPCNHGYNTRFTTKRAGIHRPFFLAFVFWPRLFFVPVWPPDWNHTG